MPEIAPDCLADILDAAQLLNPGDSMSPRVLRAIAKHAAERNIHRSVETGAGGSTLLFSQISARHTAFTVQGENSIITRVKASSLFQTATSDFIEGPTQRTLPRYTFDRPLDAVLIDGPHAFPFPQIEYFYLYPHIASDGLLIVDDIHIPTVHEFFQFLRQDDMFELIEVVERTAFFRRTTAPVFDPWQDGWWLQRYNRKPLIRYTWREALRKSLPQPLRSALRQSRALWRAGLVTGARVRIESPEDGTTVMDRSAIRGHMKLPAQAFLWIFARRADSAMWWPQDGGPARFSGQQWEHPCKFGEASDAGYAFDVAAIVLDELKHRRVLRWFTESARAGRWDPIPLPDPMPGTSIAQIRVLRAGKTTV